jgi:ribosome-associated protein
MTMIDKQDNFLDAEKPSKSERKREMQSLQDIGTRIVKLSPGDLAHIPLEGLLQEAVLTARRITNHEGLRRQMQYIGKLMRTVDTSAVTAALRDLESGRQEHNHQFHQLETLRDDLLAAGVNGMDKALALYPNADRQHLRQLITAAVKEKELQKPPAAARKLFRYLRELAEI